MISNPTPRSLEFQARYSDESLVGPPSVVLPPGPGEAYPLEFYYAPLLPGDKTASLTLTNDEVGGEAEEGGGQGRQPDAD